MHSKLLLLLVLLSYVDLLLLVLFVVIRFCESVRYTLVGPTSAFVLVACNGEKKHFPRCRHRRRCVAFCALVVKFKSVSEHPYGIQGFQRPEPDLACTRSRSGGPR